MGAALLNAMFDRRHRIYSELGVPPEEHEDPLDRWRRMKAEREEPQPREHKLDVVPPTLAEIDQRIAERIAAEHEFMTDIIIGVLRELQTEWAIGATGPPGPSGPPGEQGPAGRLPLVKVWQPDSVTYEAQVVSYEGATYQALCDTAQRPGGGHWVCIAVPGRNAKSPRGRGAFSADAKYQELDIVSRDGSSFIARKDDPGICPGKGWQLIARQGERGTIGEKGERGPKGDKGETGATISDWKIDRERYVATPVMSDGRDGPPLELRELFEQFLFETS